MQARGLFERVLPEEEFLPRAPDPDEIIFDDEGYNTEHIGTGDTHNSPDVSLSDDNNVMDIEVYFYSSHVNYTNLSPPWFGAPVICGFHIIVRKVIGSITLSRVSNY